MSSGATPKDPRQLRAEIERTRADLGDTVEALAAKTDVKARAKDAVGEATEQARATVAAAKDKASSVVATARESVREADLPEKVRRPIPLAALGAAVVLAVVVGYVVRRRRS